jgi:hypothetical protein
MNTAGFDSFSLRSYKLPRFARIPIVRLARMERQDAWVLAQEGIAGVTPSFAPSASGIAFRTEGILRGGRNEEDPDVVQIVVESWGLPQDAPLRDALVQPYAQADVLAKYQVVEGAVPFAGATIPGESRELCGVSFNFHLLNATSSELKDCLPARLAAAGYDDIALHGLNGNVFSRTEWYRAIGFQEIWFHDRFKQDGLPDCAGPFVGTCDADIAAWIGRRLEEDHAHPYFIHWMTLNSHLPVLVPTALSDGAQCSEALNLEPNSTLCSWYQLVANVNRSVAQVATGNLARPTVFVLVGDHAPPFSDPALRARFSQTDVPYVLLLPREGYLPPRTILARNTMAPRHGDKRTSRQTP